MVDIKVTVKIQAGICGFVTEVTAICPNMKLPTGINIESNCDKINALAMSIKEVNGINEITRGFDGVIMSEARKILKGCCAGCVVPAGIFKSVQVASELALPKDILLTMSKEDIQ